MSLVEIEDLKVTFNQFGGDVRAVRGVSFAVAEGESVGIVGESGSGKSVSCMALLRLLDRSARIEATTLRLDGVDMLNANRSQLADMRGRAAAIIFQDPNTAFDPVFTIGYQIVETIRTHRRLSRRAAWQEAGALLRQVEIKNADDVLHYYPHQLSGGMLQRAMIAMALSCRPKLLIADEPTTALDVTIQAQILALIKKLQAELGMALVMITHDLGVIAETVDRVVVMYNGEVREQGDVRQIFADPRDDYTRKLLASLRPGDMRNSATSSTAAPALELRGLGKSYAVRRRGGLFGRAATIEAVRGIDLKVGKNEIVGLVGESGSGKTTTGLMAMRLVEPSRGDIMVDGTDITRLDHRGLKPFRRRMQIVFQDSYTALDPMMTLAETIAEPLQIHGLFTRREQLAKAEDWLERVGLGRSFASRYPHELSGGQRQRVAIARALILDPAILVADEPTSALDVTVKAQIIGLLLKLQRELGLSMLFISHDLSVVRSLTDRVVVMYRGRVVEEAPTATLFASPRHPYTRALLDAIPVTDPTEKKSRQFLTDADIERMMPVLTPSEAGSAATAGPALVNVGGGHFVEARIAGGNS